MTKDEVSELRSKIMRVVQTSMDLEKARLGHIQAEENLESYLFLLQHPVSTTVPQTPYKSTQD